jgi:hypothetical protein
MNDDVKATAYTQISQWSACSYDDLAKTRDALGDDPLADTFNRRLKGLDKAVRRLSDLEAVVKSFEFDLAYAYPLVVKQILFSYQVLLDEIRDDLITEVYESTCLLGKGFKQRTWDLKERLDDWMGLVDDHLYH